MALTFRIAIKLWFCSIHCLALLCFRGIILVGFSGEIWVFLWVYMQQMDNIEAGA